MSVPPLAHVGDWWLQALPFVPIALFWVLFVRGRLRERRLRRAGSGSDPDGRD